MLDTMSDLVGKVDRKARKPHITKEIISKTTDKRRKCKNVNNEGRKGGTTYHKTEEHIEKGHRQG
jgi:hypothetical protein